MKLSEILAGGGGALIILATLVQIAPIKINPWTRIANAIGRSINGDVMNKLDEIKREGDVTRQRLEAHISKDDERAADSHRQRILRFNGELMRGEKHTKEHFVEVLRDIDLYEVYCRDHPDYKNSRAVLSIANVKRVYSERLEKNDFL